MNRFSGKTVVITGASAGIGAAAARQFAAEGADVVLAARGLAALEALAVELRRGGGKILCVPTDVGDADASVRLLEQAAESMGGIDVLVNNAGYNVRGAVEDHSAGELAQVVQVNLAAPIILSRTVLPYLRKRGGGAIINVASIAGKIPLAHEATYSATKFGLRAFSIALAEELVGTGITVSAVSPGPVDTSFLLADVDQVPDVVLSQPLSTADEVAAMILDCAADGKVERTLPRVSGYLATLGYLVPSLRRVLLPVMEARGRRAKERYRARDRQRRSR